MFGIAPGRARHGTCMGAGAAPPPLVTARTVARFLFVAFCSSNLPLQSQSARGGFVQAAAAQAAPWPASPALAPSFTEPEHFGIFDAARKSGTDRDDRTPPPIWTEAEMVAAGRPTPEPGRPDSREQFLVFESWGAGFNNERMSLEIAYILALVYCRTLVLPPLVGDRTRVAKQFRYEAFFDIDRMRRGIEHATQNRATLLTAEEFAARVDATPAVFGLQRKALNAVKLRPRIMERGRGPGVQSSYFAGLERFSTRILDDFDLHASVIVAEPLPVLQMSMRPATSQEKSAQDRWPTVDQFATTVRKKRLNVSSQALEESAVLNIASERLLGNYYSVVYIPERRVAVSAHATLRHFLTLRSSLYDAAEEAAAAVQEVLLSRHAAASRAAQSIAQGNGGGASERGTRIHNLIPWAAIHNRQGDFELLYPQHWLNSSQPSQVAELATRHADLWRKCAGGGVYYATSYSGLLDKHTERAQRRAVEEELLPALREAIKTDLGGENRCGSSGTLVDTVVMWKDIQARVAPPVLGKGADTYGTEWTGIVEMLICAKAPAGFVGSYASTFSGYIHRIRGGGAAARLPVSRLGDDRVASGGVVGADTTLEENFRYTRHEEGAVGVPAAVSWASVLSPSAIVWSREWSEGLGLYATER